MMTFVAIPTQLVYFEMGLFYAIAKDIALEEKDGKRYLMVFASREAADEWHRDVTDPHPRKSRTTIERVTPQFYIWDSTRYHDVSGTVQDPRSAPQSKDKVLFTLLPPRDAGELSIIPVQNITEHASGKWYVSFMLNRIAGLLII